MKMLILIMQILVSLILIVFILIQNKGTGLGRVWGGGSTSSFTRRGFEKVLFRLTFIFTFLFIIFSILQVTF